MCLSKHCIGKDNPTSNKNKDKRKKMINKSTYHLYHQFLPESIGKENPTTNKNKDKRKKVHIIYITKFSHERVQEI